MTPEERSEIKEKILSDTKETKRSIAELEQLTTGNGVNGYDGCDSCAHSNGPDNKARINCVHKGRGVWWMMAKLAGWNGSTNVNLKAFLEGPYNGPNMNTSLSDQTIIPLSQPYNIAPWNYSGTESVTSLPNSQIVDWVLVELRDAVNAESASPATTIARQAAFILDNGSIVDMDGASMLRFDIVVNQNLFAIIYHRNHLGFMSANPLVKSDGNYSLDFSLASEQALGGTDSQKEVTPGIWAMYSGDGNNDGSINIDDNILEWNIMAGTKGFLPEDYNLDGQVNNKDKLDYWLPNVGNGTVIPN